MLDLLPIKQDTMTTLTVTGIITLTALILSCLEIDDPITRITEQPRNRYTGRWSKKHLPLEITRVTRPMFRQLDERTLVRV